MTHAEITPFFFFFFKSKANFKGGTRAGVTQESPASGSPAPLHCLHTSTSQSHLLCLGWTSFSLLQAALSQTLGVQGITLDKNSSGWCSCDGSQGCKTHNVPMAGTDPLPAAFLMDQRLTWDLAKVDGAGLRCRAKGFSSWHLSRSRRWRRHWIQPEQCSAGEHGTTELNTHYKLTIDFF